LNMSHIKNLVSQIDAISVDSQALVFVNKLLAKIKNHMDILSEKIKINNISNYNEIMTEYYNSYQNLCIKTIFSYTVVINADNFLSCMKNSLNIIFTNITKNSNILCNILEKYLYKKVLGRGAVNVVYDIVNTPYIIRQSILDVDLSKLKLLEETIHVKNRKITKYILSEPLYEIVYLSLMNKLSLKYFNFVEYNGAVYCENSKRISIIMEKCDISLIDLFPILLSQIDNEVKLNAFYVIMFNIILQAAVIFDYMWNEIKICDFDRHFGNMLVRYTTDEYFKVNGFDLEKEKIYPRKYEHLGQDYSNLDTPLKYGDVYLKNIGLILKPIDFGQSVIEQENVYIYSEPETYNKSITPEYSCTFETNYMSYEEWELIKSKYGIINTDTRNNIMFYFFIINMYVNIQKMSANQEIWKTSLINTFQEFCDSIFLYDKTCGFMGISTMEQKYVKYAGGKFFVKRNLGFSNKTYKQIFKSIHIYLKLNTDMIIN